jgi:NDP-sugar pyrophosphorylase family protein
MSAPPDPPPGAGAARAMILAAGLGTRLRPLTDRTPKPLVEVDGVPLIAYGLRLLRHAGIRDVVVNLHHLGEQVMSGLGDGSRYGVRIHYSLERVLLDTGGGIRHARPLLDRLGAPDTPIIVLNSDVISEIPVADVLRSHRDNGADVTLVLRGDPRARDYGVFGIDEVGRVRRFLGQGDPPTGLRELMFASLQVIEPKVLDAMPGDRPFGTMRDLYPAMFRAGARFFGFAYDGLWFTADTPADLAAADAELRRRGRPSYMAG